MRWRTPISKAAAAGGLLALATSLPIGWTAEPASPLENVEHEVCAIYDSAKDAVVRVHAERPAPPDNMLVSPVHRAGTGFFIRRDGVLLTAAAVVRDADTFWIEWQDRPLPARLLGRCERTNLAVLQINGQTPFLSPGDSDALRVGSLVITIGYPFDLPPAPVLGAITGFDIRRGTNVFATTQFRASGRLSPGQAGGPVLDSHGRVIGVALAAHLEEQTYLLPINAARRVYEDLLQFGEVRFGWVGLEVSERQRVATDGNPSATELIVKEVFPDTPAAAAGFQPGDQLVRVTTNEVRCLADVLDSMFLRRSGDQVEFTVRRSTKEVQVSLTIGTRPGENALARRAAPAALRLTPVSHDR